MGPTLEPGLQLTERLCMEYNKEIISSRCKFIAPRWKAECFKEVFN